MNHFGPEHGELTTPVKVYMLTLGIFDDYDVVPTIVQGFYKESITASHFDNSHELLELVELLKSAAEDEYGRSFPDSAMFWAATVSEVEE